MTDEPKPDVCPKCLTAAYEETSFMFSGSTKRLYDVFDCGTRKMYDGGICQSDQCKIRELTQQLATITRQRDEAVHYLIVTDEMNWSVNTQNWLAREGLPTQQENHDSR